METKENTNTSISIQSQIKNLLAYLNTNIYGKEEPLRLALLASIAKESVFFAGLPGVGKSLMSRKVASAFTDIDPKKDVFEHLMNEYSTPDEIFGPVSLKQLENDKYVRLTENYLPTAKVAFLDEIWKSGPAILNTLLTIVNEKIYHNGDSIEKVPLVSVIAASNELPAKGKGLEALWDRFLLRIFVNPVESTKDFFNVVNFSSEAVEPSEEQKASLLKIEDINAWQSEIEKVSLSNVAQKVIMSIRKQLCLLNQDENHQSDEAYYVSDRRWKKVVHILKTSAFLNGRDFVDLMDCSLIEYAIWNTEKQHNEVSQIIATILSENASDKKVDITNLNNEVQAFENTVNETWFNKIKIPEEQIIKTYNGKDYYLCTKDDDGKTYYIQKNDYYNSRDVYNTKLKYVTCLNNTEINGNHIAEIYYPYNNYTIKTKPATHKYEVKLLNPAAKKFILKNFEKEFYQPLLKKLKDEIKSLNNFKKTNSKIFKENLFANQKYLPIIFEKTDANIKKLEDLILKIEEQHSRYSDKENEIYQYQTGDFVLKTGEIVNKNLAKKIAEDNILAEVCVSDANETLFISRKSMDNTSWQEAYQNQSQVADETVNVALQTGWKMPNKAELDCIFKNKDDLSTKLKGKFWSRENITNGAWFHDFDTNTSDCTTKDHEFSALFIKKIA